MKKKTTLEAVKEYIGRLDVTTCTLYRKDRELLEELRLVHISNTKQVIGVTDFLSCVIQFYKKKGGR